MKANANSRGIIATNLLGQDLICIIRQLHKEKKYISVLLTPKRHFKRREENGICMEKLRKE